MIIFSYKAYLVKVMPKGEEGGQKSRKIDDVFYEYRQIATAFERLEESPTECYKIDLQRGQK